MSFIPDLTARGIVDRWTQLSSERNNWLSRTADLRKYINAPDTSYTEVGKLEWKNRTVIPKLTQIFDNLIAQYKQALMPNDDWLSFQGYSVEDAKKEAYIEQYIKYKLEQSDFELTLRKILTDFVIYGVCCAGVRFVEDTSISPVTQEEIVRYKGGKIFRVSPLDFVIEPRASSFDESIFIRRYLMPVNELKKLQENPELSPFKINSESITEAIKTRGFFYELEDDIKESGFRVDGFGSPQEYFMSGHVEVLEFWGDFYDPENDIYKPNQTIAVIDRMWTLYEGDNPMLNGKKPYAFTSWRERTDNLYGQSPLEQLVGMQYRIDHLENLKADIFDLIAHPVVVITGNPTEDFEWKPGNVYYAGLEGKVEMMRPDATALAANTEISLYMNLMEEMAGAPKQTAGFRTPGEKTAYEVSVLQTGANKMFLEKTSHFEQSFLKRILENFYIITITNLDSEDFMRIFNEELNTYEIIGVNKSDIVADGQFKLSGSSHFEKRQRAVQELTQVVNTISSIPSTSYHIDGYQVARLLERELGFERYSLVKEYKAIEDSVNAQAVQQMTAQENQGLLQMNGVPNQQATQGEQNVG